MSQQKLQRKLKEQHHQQLQDQEDLDAAEIRQRDQQQRLQERSEKQQELQNELKREHLQQAQRQLRLERQRQELLRVQNEYDLQTQRQADKEASLLALQKSSRWDWSCTSSWRKSMKQRLGKPKTNWSFSGKYRMSSRRGCCVKRSIKTRYR